jgi:hypothetical protein
MMRLIKNSLDRSNFVRKVGIICRIENELLVKDREEQVNLSLNNFNHVKYVNGNNGYLVFEVFDLG